MCFFDVCFQVLFASFTLLPYRVYLVILNRPTLMESLLNDRKQSRVGQMLQKVCQMQPVQKSSQLRVGQVRVSYMQSSQKN